jgi:sugar/nucleoside kinase (ribokinase family)
MVRDLDAIYENFISGFELCLGTAQALRQGFSGPLYADFHSLFLGMNQDGIRRLQPLPQASSWFGCFDAVQMNEDEMHQLSPDPLSLAAQAISAGVSLLTVTLGRRGAAYVAAPGFERLADRGKAATGSTRTALVPAPAVDALDPTGCGDVFGGTLIGRLLAGDPVEEALAFANRMAARTAAYRGATGLNRHLRGELVTP